MILSILYLYNLVKKNLPDHTGGIQTINFKDLPKKEVLGFIAILLLELIALYFVVKVVFGCNEAGKMRFFNFTFGVIFPIPYLINSVFFGKCEQKALFT